QGGRGSTRKRIQLRSARPVCACQKAQSLIASGKETSLLQRRLVMSARVAQLAVLFGVLGACCSATAETAEDLAAKARAVLAQLDGEIKTPGLEQPVEVLRDRWGVAHIYAKNADDLFFAQGFIVAQDRLFQIDMWRRTAAGETAEVLGK